jgi:hypothetical protein
MPTLDRIFVARVTAPGTLLARGPAADEVCYKLSPRAAQLLAAIDHPMSLANALTQVGFPRRDTMRMLAGLLRRKAVEHRPV